MEIEFSRSLKIMLIESESPITGTSSAVIDKILPIVNSRVQVYNLPAISNHSPVDSGSIQKWKWRIFLNHLVRLIRSIRKFCPDILHIHVSHAQTWLKESVFIWIGKLMKCKIIVDFSETDFRSQNFDHTSLVSSIFWKVMEKVDAVLTTSDKWKSFLTSVIQSEKIYSVSNFIQVPDEHVLPLRQNNQIIYGFFPGDIGSQRETIDLIEAIGKIKPNGHEVRVWISGIEEQSQDFVHTRQKLESLHLEKRCELIGNLAGLKRKEYLQSMDFLVSPSYSDEWPSAILEGVAEGRAIIAKQTESLSNLVIDGFNGFIVDPGNVEMLANRIGILADHPDLCIQMGRSSHELAKRKLGIDHYVNRLVGIYEGLIYDFT